MFWRRSALAKDPSGDVLPDRQAHCAEGLRIYAIGDMHGMLGLTIQMFDEIEADLAAWDGKAIIIGLGDYIDRGPHSYGVIEQLIRRTQSTTYRLVALRGNHEDVMLRFLDKPEIFGADWLQLGGAATLSAYGVKLPRTKPSFTSVRDQLVSSIPVEHLAFLQALPLRFEHKGLFFSHAGARPGVPLLNQTERDLLWMRWRQPAGALECEKILIHGHTPVPQARVEGGRINVDTGAYATGRLSAVRITPAGINFLSVTEMEATY